MFSKRKSEATDTTNMKKMKSSTDILVYIEKEREKLNLEKESVESVENYLSQKWRSMQTFHISASFHQSFSEFPRTTMGSQTNNGQSTEQSSHSSNSHIVRNVESSYPEINIEQYLIPSITYMTFRASYPNCNQHEHLDTAQNFNSEFRSIVCPRFQDSAVSSISDKSLVTHLVDLLREWNTDIYQNCMDEYASKRICNPYFWDRMFLKAIPFVFLEHSTTAVIVAQFFHTMCRDLKRRTALLNLKPSYLQFFLMNMAAVNQIECSLVIDDWALAKQELIKTAFVTGRLSHLQMLLQYFRPTDLWSNADMEFLMVSTINSEARADNMDSVTSFYYANLTLLNLVRVATFVSASQESKYILADCIRLYWRSSEMPYVSPSDLKNAFSPLHRSLLLRHTLIRACEELLLATYPEECLAEYQPRSLMHLSRCKIRQYLISQVFVPLLPLPQKIISYINLDW